MAGDERTTGIPAEPGASSSAPRPVTTSDVKAETPASAAPVAEKGKRVGILNGDRYQALTIGVDMYYDGDRILEEKLQPGEFDRLLEDKGIYLEGTSKPKIRKGKASRAGMPDDYVPPDYDDDEDDDDDDDDDEDDDVDAGEVTVKHQGRETIVSGALARRGRR